MSGGPYDNATPLTPHAANPIEHAVKQIWVGGAGTLVCRFAGGSADVTLAGIPAGTMLYGISPTHIRATSTATLLVGFY
jgi:hypothetical protein